MKFSTESIAFACARHPWRTIGAWIVLVVVSFVVIATLFGDLTSEGEVTSETDSKRVDELRFERFTPTAEDFQQQVSEVVVISLEEGTLDDPAVEERVQALADELREVGATNVVTHADQEELVADDREATVVLVGLGPNEDAIGDVVDAVDRLDAEPGFDAAVTGEVVLDEDFSALSEQDLQEGELFFGAPAALIVLLLVFGAVVAGVIPLVLALLSILVAIALTAIVGQVFELSIFVTNMIFGMGLALGIDYSLFILSRFREERRGGREKADGHRHRRGYGEPCGALQRRGVRARDDGARARPEHDHAEPGDRRDPRGHRLGDRGADAPAGGPEPARRPHRLPSRAVLRPCLGRGGEPVLGDDRPRGHASSRREPRRGRRPPARRGGSLPLARDRDGRHQHAARALRVAAGLRAPQPRVPRADHRPGPDRRRRRRRVGRGPGRGGAADRGAGGARDLRRAAGGDEHRQRPGARHGSGGRGLRLRGGRRRRPRAARGRDPRGVRRHGGPGLRGRRHGRGHRLLRRHERVAPDRDHVRAGPELRPAHDRVSLHRRPGDGDRHEPAGGRRGLRPARARVREGRRERDLRLPAGGHHRGVGAALPLRRPLRALDGLPGLPAQPHPRALLADGRQRGRGGVRGRLDGAPDHRRGADHHRRLRGLRARRSGHVPADGVRGRGRPVHRRHDRPVGGRPGDDDAPRPLELVPAVVAFVAPGRARRRPRGEPSALGGASR